MFGERLVRVSPGCLSRCFSSCFFISFQTNPLIVLRLGNDHHDVWRSGIKLLGLLTFGCSVHGGERLDSRFDHFTWGKQRPLSVGCASVLPFYLKLPYGVVHLWFCLSERCKQCVIFEVFMVARVKIWSCKMSCYTV